ncbi:MAG: TrmB family transcriptional regulator, partial [Spirochaetes bacterium]|nr:TrmB family transcriptional regulator [Spirochaetota bacterium]
ENPISFILFIILTTMVVNIINKMKEIGFSEYECKAYLALLEENPVTAYELAKKSGIPTSKIYETISKLIEKDAVFELIESGKKRYLPADSNELISVFSGKINKTLNDLKNDLNGISTRQNVSYIFTINSYETLIKRAISLIQSAEKTLLISGWKNDLENLKEEISKKSIQTAIVIFGEDINLPDMMTYSHPVGHTLFSEKGGRQFVICSDSQEAISGTIYEKGITEAAWSKNEGFVSLAEDFIKHDIYILKVVNRFNDLLISTYGDNFDKLRNIFKDEVNL